MSTSTGLYVKSAIANEGPRMKRIRPAPMGRAYRYQRRISHMEIVLAEKASGDGKAAPHEVGDGKPAPRKESGEEDGGQEVGCEEAPAKKFAGKKTAGKK